MPLINSLLVRSGTGWSERTDPASITANSRIEAYLALGAVQTEDGVNAYADAQLDLYATAREEVNTGIAPIGDEDTPYIGYQVGDTVTVPNSAGSPTVERVRGITVTENDDTGIAVYSPQFKDFILERDEQIQIAIKKMSNGAIAGSSQVAQPIRETFVPREVPGTLGSGFPFIVVASDGTGDYLDPKQAIDAIAVNIPTVIFIKNTGSTYTTTSCDLTGKKIVLWGVSTQMRFPSTTLTGPSWTFSSNGNFTMSSSTVLHVIGIMIDSASTQLGMVAGAQLYLDQASLGGGGSTMALSAGTTYAYQSQFPIHSTSFSGAINAWDCEIRVPNATMTLTAVDLIWRGCSILPGGASTHMTLAYNAGSSGAQLSITDCDFGEFNELILSGWNQATFKGNTNHSFVSGGALGSRLSLLTCTSCDELVVDSTMWGTTLVVNGSQRVNIGGIWGTTTGSTIAASGGSINATFDGDNGLGAFPNTLLTISGSHLAGSIFLNGSNTNGVTVSGDSNVLAVTGTNNAGNLVNVPAGGDNNKFMVEVGATTADAGAGNVFL